MKKECKSTKSAERVVLVCFDCGEEFDAPSRSEMPLCPECGSTEILDRGTEELLATE